MSKKELTENQQKLLDLLFSDDWDGKDVRKLMDKAGYSKGTDVSHTLSSIRDEFLKRSELSLLIKTPKAMRVIDQVLDTPKPMGADTRLKAAEMIFDRTGLVKKEKLEIEGELSNAILVLPAKDQRDE